MPFKDWVKVIVVSAATLSVTLAVCYGAYSLAVDTAVKVIHNR